MFGVLIFRENDIKSHGNGLSGCKVKMNDISLVTYLYNYLFLFFQEKDGIRGSET